MPTPTLSQSSPLVTTLLVCFILCGSAAGCAHLAAAPGWNTATLQQVPLPWSATDGLPSRTEIVAGQLVIHTDFAAALRTHLESLIPQPK